MTRPFQRVFAVCSFIPKCFDWKVQRFCWPKGTSLECADSIYVEITEAACVSDELCRLKEEEEEEEEEEVGQIVSLGDSRAYKACTGPYSYRKHAI